MTETGKLQTDYFRVLDEHLKGSDVGPSTSGKRNYRRFAFPKTGCHLDALMQIRDHTLQVGLRIRSDDQDEVFNSLLQQKPDIETAIGSPLIWDEKEGKRQCWIYVEREADPTDRNSWHDQHQWMRTMLENFQSVFSRYVS
jgi:hypothetical protein